MNSKTLQYKKMREYVINVMLHNVINIFLMLNVLWLWSMNWIALIFFCRNADRIYHMNVIRI